MFKSLILLNDGPKFKGSDAGKSCMPEKLARVSLTERCKFSVQGKKKVLC